MSTKSKQIIAELNKMKNPEGAKHAQRFFKTGKGEYGEGDVFLGLTTPQVKEIVKKHYKDAILSDLEALLNSKYHEHRSTALLILVNKMQKAEEKEQKAIVDFYLKYTDRINNWDLVDISAYHVLGRYFYHQGGGEKVLRKLAKSKHLWSERISVVATMYYIKKGDFGLILEFAKHFLNHKHDLMHKAVGWMLREVGKKDKKVLVKFLDEYTAKMPRTALRYAIEKFPETERLKYLRLPVK